MEKARNNSSVGIGKSQEQKGGLQAQTDKNNVHFASLMDMCHLKNAELEPKLQKYKGTVVPREDNVKDDSGAHAVFAEQGSSSSQMTAAAKKEDVIARLPGCDGQAAAAVYLPILR